MRISEFIKVLEDWKQKNGDSFLYAQDGMDPSDWCAVEGLEWRQRWDVEQQKFIDDKEAGTEIVTGF